MDSSDPQPVSGRPAEDRLDSWKEIASYLGRDSKTVQRWEKREGMPVHRHVHDKLGSVYAFRSEIDAWMKRRAVAATVAVTPDSAPLTAGAEDVAGGDLHDAPPFRPGEASAPHRRWPAGRTLASSVAVLVLFAAGATWWLAQQRDAAARRLLDGASFASVTDFDAIEQPAAISRDGRFVAFVSDRDGPPDVWVTQLGTGQFYNLTRGRARELVNPAVRTLGFSPDGAQVTFWARGVIGAGSDAISVWAIPTLGGLPRPYLEGVAEYDWTRDGSRLVFHTPGPGDPTFVGETGLRPGDQPIFTVPEGLHAHFQTWSPDGAFIYFVEGSVPDGLDLYRMTRDGRDVERLTRHNAGVSHPVIVDEHILIYLVAEKDGTGSRLHAMDVRRRVPWPLGAGVERYHSLAASADGRRLVAARADTKGTLWRLPIDGREPDGAPPATLIALPTGRGRSPRLGPGYLLYVSSRGTRHAIYRMADGVATEIWGLADGRIIGGPEIAPDGRRLAVSVEQHGRTLLYIMNADGTGARVVSDTLELHGSPAWTPDGQSLTSGAIIDGTAQLVQIPLDRSAVVLVPHFASDPIWSPDGSFVAYSGADVGTVFPLKAATTSGAVYPIPDFTLTRGARRLRFAGQGHALVFMRGDMLSKDLWLIDLDTGAERQLTNLPPGFVIRDFDLSADGREVVVERVQEYSDVVLITRADAR